MEFPICCCWLARSAPRMMTRTLAPRSAPSSRTIPIIRWLPSCWPSSRRSRRSRTQAWRRMRAWRRQSQWQSQCQSQRQSQWQSQWQRQRQGQSQRQRRSQRRRWALRQPSRSGGHGPRSAALRRSLFMTSMISWRRLLVTMRSSMDGRRSVTTNGTCGKGAPSSLGAISHALARSSIVLSRPVRGRPRRWTGSVTCPPASKTSTPPCATSVWRRSEAIRTAITILGRRTKALDAMKKRSRRTTLT